MSYYKQHKPYLNECRKLNYIINKWDFIDTKDEARVWLKNRKIYKAILKNKDSIEAEDFVSLLMKILDLEKN